ncbi:hypothetical protein RJ641_004464 [Dillenia turbinata]|uniref:Uncharacterized protein n=1 Tax=Dillenia turbinata TaxID=194707 RepID=A0AAN8VA02_9MAGN
MVQISWDCGRLKLLVCQLVWFLLSRPLCIEWASGKDRMIIALATSQLRVIAQHMQNQFTLFQIRPSTVTVTPSGPINAHQGRRKVKQAEARDHGETLLHCSKWGCLGHNKRHAAKILASGSRIGVTGRSRWRSENIAPSSWWRWYTTTPQSMPRGGQMNLSKSQQKQAQQPKAKPRFNPPSLPPKKKLPSTPSHWKQQDMAWSKKPRKKPHAGQHSQGKKPKKHPSLGPNGLKKTGSGPARARLWGQETQDKLHNDASDTLGAGAGHYSTGKAAKMRDAGAEKIQEVEVSLSQSAREAKDKASHKMGEARKRTSRTAQEANEKASQKAGETAEKTSQTAQAAKEKASEKAQEAKEKAYEEAQEAEKEASEMAQEARKKASEAREGAKSGGSEAEQKLSWAKEKAKEGYEAAKTKAEETVGSAKNTITSNIEAAKHKTQATKDNIAGSPSSPQQNLHDEEL